MALANQRFQVKLYPTALATDVIFYEVADEVLPKNKLPTYGTPHHDPVHWPNHKLVFITNRKEDGKQIWFYAADRENQDLYNWSFSKADIGGTKFDAVTRTYITPRNEFTPDTPAMGSAMPDSPSGTFSGEFVLAQRQQTRSADEELNSLYVFDTHVYVKKVSISNVRMNDETGRVKRSVTTMYYRGEEINSTPIEDLADDPSDPYWGQQVDGIFRELEQISDNWFAVAESNVIADNSVNSSANPAKARVINRVTPLGTDIYFTEVGAMPDPAPAYGSAHYDTVNWPDHKLSFISPADASGLLFKFHYVANRAAQDEYNFTSAQADIGGKKFDSVDRTYLEPRDSFVEKAVSMGTTMPDVPSDAFGAGYVLASEEQSRTGDPQFDNLYITITRTYVRKVTLGEIGYDEQTGRSTSTTITLRYSGEVTSDSYTIDTLFADKDNAYWGLQSSGVFRTVEQLSANWFAVEERSILPESPENGSANPAKARVIMRNTPLGTDIYFTEVGAMPDPAPAYGSDHYDTVNWPDHRLLLITPEGPSGLLYKFHYLADRDNQDLYNWSFTKAGIGNAKFDAVTRTYVIPRESFTPDAPAMGSAMSAEPAGTFSGDFVLAQRQQERTEQDELDSRYVFDTHVYIKKVSTSNIRLDNVTGRVNRVVTTMYYRGEEIDSTPVEELAADTSNPYWGQQEDGTFRELEQTSDNWFAVAESNVIADNSINESSNPARTRVIMRNTPLGTDLYFTEVGAMPSPAPAYGSSHYDSTNWPSHKLLLITPEGPTGLLYKFHYLADREDQDLYNWEITTGEQLIRTYVVDKVNYDPDDAPDVGEAGLDIRFTKYGFADETIVEAPEELRSKYVLLKRRFIEPVQKNVVWDDTLDTYIDIVKTVIPAGSVTAEDLPVDQIGLKVEIQNGNTFYDVKIEQIVPEAALETRLVDEYGTTFDYKNLPQKLESVDIKYAYAWASSANFAPSYAEDFFFDYKITEPRQGPYEGKIMRYITSDPDEVFTLHPLQIIPQTRRETVAVIGSWWYASNTTGNQTSAVAKEIVLPATIHDTITVDFSGDGDPPSEGTLGSIKTTTLAATPNAVDFFNLTDLSPIQYIVKPLDYSLYEVSVVLVDFSNLYV